MVTCRHTSTDAKAVGHCDLEIAYVEAGESPSVYWMRLCDDGLEFQPLGWEASVRHLPAERLRDVHAVAGSLEFQNSIRELVTRYPKHSVPANQAFYAIRYSGQEVHVPSDELPAVVHGLFVQLNDLFDRTFSYYRDYLMH